MPGPPPMLDLGPADVIRISPQRRYVIEVDIELEYAAVPGATPNASRWIGAIDSLYGGLRHGVVSVRDIAGTDTRSQHSYGNAVDTFGSWPQMESIFDFGIANASMFSIRLLILRDVQWYSGALGHYGGIYHNHVHADFWPQYPL